jgi:hypothetical protein
VTPRRTCRYCRRWYTGVEYPDHKPARRFPRHAVDHARCIYHAPRIHGTDAIWGEWPMTSEDARCRHFRRAWWYTATDLAIGAYEHIKWKVWKR